MINIRDTVARAKPHGFEKPIAIYGAGNTGRAVAKYLESRGRAVVGFIDQNAGDGQSCLGKPLFSLRECVKAIQTGGVELLVAIHNRDVDMPPLIQQLSGYGFSDVLTMVDYANAFPDDGAFRYWLSARSLFLKYEEGIDKLLGLLADEESKHWVDRILQFRITGNYSCLPSPDTENQYVPRGLERWADPLRFIDCGAYNGDTIDLLIAHGYNIQKILAFEPDPGNYDHLVKKFPDKDRVFLPCGVSSSNHLAKFVIGAGEGSHQVSDGGVSIQMVRIDDVMPDFKPNLIKMDVEGGEIDALQGAGSTISRFRPGLAVSLYHRPEDLWQIPLLIDSWNLGYRFYVRGHLHSSFESVLYATTS
jgi:FkbM family methyltransferase